MRRWDSSTTVLPDLVAASPPPCFCSFLPENMKSIYEKRRFFSQGNLHPLKWTDAAGVSHPSSLFNNFVNTILSLGILSNVILTPPNANFWMQNTCVVLDWMGPASSSSSSSKSALKWLFAAPSVAVNVYVSPSTWQVGGNRQSASSTWSVCFQGRVSVELVNHSEF